MSSQGHAMGRIEPPFPNPIRSRLGTDMYKMEQVPRKIEVFARRYLGFKLMPFHREILWRLMRGGWHDIMMAHLHGKSTICNVVFPLASLASNPDGAHILVGSTIRDSQSWLARIAGELEFNEQLLHDYPWLQKPGRGDASYKWNASEITVSGRANRSNRNPSVAALGEGSNDIRGRRGMAILDDIEGEKHRDSEVERHRTYQWLTLEATRAMESVADNPRRLFANIGTPFDVESIHFKLEDQHGFEVFKQPYKHEDGSYVWPRMKPMIQEKVKMWGGWQSEAVAIAFGLDPTAGDETMKSARQILHQSTTKNSSLEQPQVFVSLDPASGLRTKKVDYTGICVVSIVWEADSPLPTVDVIDAENFKSGVIEQVHRAAHLSLEHGNCPIIFEGNSQQRGTYQSLFRQFYPEVELIVHITTREKKLDPGMGVTVVKTLQNRNLLHFVEPNGEDTHPGMAAFAREIANLRPTTRNVHDHITMACWFAIRHVYEHRRRVRVPKLVARMGGPRSNVIDISKFRRAG